MEEKINSSKENATNRKNNVRENKYNSKKKNIQSSANSTTSGKEHFAKNKNRKVENIKNKKNSSEFQFKRVDQARENKRYENNKKIKSSSSNSKLKIIPLGGMNEIGKNITVFEYENDIVVIDCGVAFPDDEMLGVDLVIPDMSYLEKNKDKIRALLITHGHEDHIGSIPYFLKKFNVPIYGTKLTLGLIRAKLIEHKLDKTADFRLVEPRDIVVIGKMKFEFIRVTHSIADSCAIAITTPEGVIVHTGDFKVDYTPIDNGYIDLARFAELGSEGVTLLMSDSTNIERPGHTMSERKVGAEFDRLFMNCTKRIIVATFASNIHRMQQIINSAVKYKRKVAVCGRSMLNVIKVGSELGYITAPEGTLIDIDKIDIYNPEQLVIITTGSQGEPMAALSRMSAGEHKKVTITADDFIIFSSSPIPGNEKSVSRLIDELEKLGAEVIYNQLADVHVSGHACQEELKLMLSLIRPKYFMPVHGEYRFLKHHGELGVSVGVEKDNIVIMENGRVLEMKDGKVNKASQVQSGIVLVDGLGVGDVGNIVIRDRQMLSENGMIIVIITLDRKTSNIVAGPEIVTRGFVYVRENEQLMDEIKTVAREELELCIKNKQLEWSTIKSNVRDSVTEYVYRKTKREPMILPIISEVDIDSYIKSNS